MSNYKIRIATPAISAVCLVCALAVGGPGKMALVIIAAAASIVSLALTIRAGKAKP
ncbi:MAG: hypothetical protein LBS91_03390 [Clostridiales Family XIII bacterium]|jgi:hypothetical protein|nr:hypothetical protein [Clostridiales Family XIII bacterium]